MPAACCHMPEQAGHLTHSDILCRDIDEVIANSYGDSDFVVYTEKSGYKLRRVKDYQYPSWIAPGCKHAVRMDSLCKGYTGEYIFDCIERQMDKGFFIAYVKPWKLSTPLKNLESETAKLDRMNGIQLTFSRSF